MEPRAQDWRHSAQDWSSVGGNRSSGRDPLFFVLSSSSLHVLQIPILCPAPNLAPARNTPLSLHLLPVLHLSLSSCLQTPHPRCHLLLPGMMPQAGHRTQQGACVGSVLALPSQQTNVRTPRRGEGWEKRAEGPAQSLPAAVQHPDLLLSLGKARMAAGVGACFPESSPQQLWRNGCRGRAVC